MPRVAPVVFRADRSLRVLLFFLSLGWLFVLYAYNDLPSNVLQVVIPVLGVLTLHTLLRRNRTLYDPEANVLVRYTGYVPFLRRKEMGSEEFTELILEGDTKDIVSRAQLIAVVEPNGERVILDKRIGTSSDEMLRIVEGISDRMNLALRVEDEFENVVRKTRFSRSVRRIVRPIAATIWGLVCAGAAFVVSYLVLVREGYPVKDAEVYIDLYSRDTPRALTQGFKIEAFCVLILWTGLLMAYRAYLGVTRKPPQFEEPDEELTAPSFSETVTT